jgi:hypothetical protein
VPCGTAAPIRSCSRWGLPCRPCCQGRGALLPHRFALARGMPCGSCAGGLFSVALSLGSPPPVVSRHRISVEPGLSSDALRHQRPSGRLAGHQCAELRRRSRWKKANASRRCCGRWLLWTLWINPSSSWPGLYIKPGHPHHHRCRARRPGLVPAIPTCADAARDGRVKPGHDVGLAGRPWALAAIT